MVWGFALSLDNLQGGIGREVGEPAGALQVADRVYHRDKLHTDSIMSRRRYLERPSIPESIAGKEMCC